MQILFYSTAQSALIPYVSMNYNQKEERETMPRIKKAPKVAEEVKAKKPVKAAAAKVKAAAEKPAAKAKARKLEIMIQSPWAESSLLKKSQQKCRRAPRATTSVLTRISSGGSTAMKPAP